MLKFKQQSGNQKTWKFEQKRWESIKTVEIWARSGNQLKFWNLSKKVGIDLNIEIWAKKWELNKVLKFEWKGGNQIKFWNLSKKVGFG